MTLIANEWSWGDPIRQAKKMVKMRMAMMASGARNSTLRSHRGFILKE
jgi:hypothetical protein